MTRERYQIKEMVSRWRDIVTIQCVFFSRRIKKWSGGPFFILLGEQKRFSKEGEEMKRKNRSRCISAVLAVSMMVTALSG